MAVRARYNGRRTTECDRRTIGGARHRGARSGLRPHRTRSRCTTRVGDLEIFARLECARSIIAFVGQRLGTGHLCPVSRCARTRRPTRTDLFAGKQRVPAGSRRNPVLDARTLQRIARLSVESTVDARRRTAIVFSSCRNRACRSSDRTCADNYRRTTGSDCTHMDGAHAVAVDSTCRSSTRSRRRVATSHRWCNRTAPHVCEAWIATGRSSCPVFSGQRVVARSAYTRANRDGFGAGTRVDCTNARRWRSTWRNCDGSGRSRSRHVLGYDCIAPRCMGRCGRTTARCPG